MTAPASRIVANHYVLAVPDIAVTARWWIDVLGFALVGEPEGWKLLRRDSCMVMIGECPDAIPPHDLGDHSYFGYLVVDDVDAWFADIRTRDTEILFEPADKPWGMREMGVRTPDGHRVMIGQDIDPPAPA
ncbi:MAG: VOC family protein [Pseudomonadota bacterium]|nr:VOC family protein [Pseudomonadota bacterium]